MDLLPYGNISWLNLHLAPAASRDTDQIAGSHSACLQAGHTTTFLRDASYMQATPANVRGEIDRGGFTRKRDLQWGNALRFDAYCTNDRWLDITEESLTMRGQAQRGPATIVWRDRPEDGADLDEGVDDPSRRRRRDDQCVNHIGHRAARARRDACESAPAIHGEIGTCERVLDARGDQRCSSEQLECVRDSFHDLPSETSRPTVLILRPEEHQHAR